MTADEPRACPNCEQGKHGICDVEVWDDTVEDWAPCPCDLRGHGPTFALSHEKRMTS